jgi:hypothetical protein
MGTTGLSFGFNYIPHSCVALSLEMRSPLSSSSSQFLTMSTELPPSSTVGPSTNPGASPPTAAATPLGLSGTSKSTPTKDIHGGGFQALTKSLEHPMHQGHGFLAPEPEPATSTMQFWAAITARSLSAILFILVLVWLVGEAGGLAWHPNPNFFNLHPFFMLLGIGVFMTNSVVSWRDAPFGIRHVLVKMLHLFLNLCAMLFIGLGLYVTFKANDSPHFVSFHSWAALVALVFLGLQAVGGMTVYVFPVMPLSWREIMLPKHGK